MAWGLGFGLWVPRVYGGYGLDRLLSLLRAMGRVMMMVVLVCWLSCVVEAFGSGTACESGSGTSMCRMGPSSLREFEFRKRWAWAVTCCWVFAGGLGGFAVLGISDCALLHRGSYIVVGLGRWAWSLDVERG